MKASHRGHGALQPLVGAGSKKRSPIREVGDRFPPLVPTRMAVMFVRRPGPAVSPPGPLPQPGAGRGEGPADPLAPWVTGALSGDDRALQRLLEEVAPTVVGLVRVVLGARSPDVDDVAQEALL